EVTFQDQKYEEEKRREDVKTRCDGRPEEESRKKPAQTRIGIYKALFRRFQFNRFQTKLNWFKIDTQQKKMKK
ncbi:hypothetical protein RUM43_005014, partial [Polyplax serrata]